MLDPTQLLWTQIGAGVCLLLAGGTLFNLLRFRGQMKAARNWSKVEGEIIVSEVNQPPSHVSDDLNDASPIIRYRYRAGGQDLESDQIKIGGQPMTTRVLAGQLVARYPIGARVNVYMDQNNPANVLLEPRQQDNLVALFAFTIVFGFIAIILTAHALAGKVVYTSNGVPLFGFALPIIAFLFAIMGLASFVWERRRATASLRWPTVAGKITASTVIEEVIEDKSNDDKSFIRTISRYQVDLRYAYQVDKRDFVGTVGKWGWTSVYGLRELAETAASRYTQGQPVTVYYDPEQPSQAVLEPGNRQGSMAPLIFGVISAVVGAGILTFLVRFGFNN